MPRSHDDNNNNTTHEKQSVLARYHRVQEKGRQRGGEAEEEGDDIAHEKRSVLALHAQEKQVADEEEEDNDDTARAKHSVLTSYHRAPRGDERGTQESGGTVSTRRKRTSGGRPPAEEEEENASKIEPPGWNDVATTVAIAGDDRDQESHPNDDDDDPPHRDRSETEDDLAVPVATPVERKSTTQMALATAAVVDTGTSCLERLGRRGCIVLIGAQVAAVVVVVVVIVVVLLVGRKDDDDGTGDRNAESLTRVPTTPSSPTIQPALSSSASSMAPSRSVSRSMSPSDAPTAFPVPDVCEFRIDALDPIFPDNTPDDPITCQSQPNRIEVLFVGGNCSSNSECVDPSTECQDFFDNGAVPMYPGENETFRILYNGVESFVSPPDPLVLENGGNDLLLFNTLEIHRDDPPYSANTTLLQRTTFVLTCNSQALCFRSIGAMVMIGFVSEEQGYAPCVLVTPTDPARFRYAISIPPKLPQGEDTAVISLVAVETDFTFPPIQSLIDLADTVLTTANRTVHFELEAFTTTLWDARNLTTNVLVMGRTADLDLDCSVIQTFSFPYEPPDQPNAIDFSSVCPT